MESVFFSFLANLVTAGSLTTPMLVLILILLVCLLSFYIFRPMYRLIKEIPTKHEINDFIDSKKEFDKVYLDAVGNKLDSILKIIDRMGDVDQETSREVNEMRRDIESVKQILNQFQGHMMYGNTTSDFRNRELK